jgi:allantoinase
VDELAVDLRIDAAHAVIGRHVRPATIGVRHGYVSLIADHGARLPASRTLELGDDVVLLPGLVDSHLHVDEPGHADWEGFDSATRSAAAGGITSIVDMPLDSIPVTTDVRALELKRDAARDRCYVDVGFWAGLVPSNVSELSQLHEAGALGFKCFLADSGTPQLPPVDAAALHAGMAEVARLGTRLLVHAESQGELAAAPTVSGRRYADFLASRPACAEEQAVATVIDAVRRTGARAHIVHVSSATTLPQLAAAKAEGLPVTAETCPHYLTLHAEDVADGATEYACCPPIRDSANAAALWAGLADGTLDLIVSDHSPCPVELKHRDSGDFGRAWGGISSLQLGLSLIWTHARNRGFGLPDIARWMADQPARLAGLATKGRITVGAAADFCVFDPRAQFVVDPARLHHRQPLTPYAGHTLIGVVRQTWLAGEPVCTDGVPRGRELRRSYVPSREVLLCSCSSSTRTPPSR